LAQQVERMLAGKAGHAEIRQHDVRPEVGQRGEEARLVVDQAHLVADVVGVKLGQHQLGIELAVLDLQHPDGRDRP
jgi:hypothetical protein